MDAISKMVSLLILIMCLTFVPLYQLLEKQDALVYQEVRKEVTSFVDNVRHKGYITPQMYNDLQATLNVGDHVYDVKMKHGEKVIIPVYTDPNNPATFQNDWEETTNEYFDEQILAVLFPNNHEPIDAESRVYYLQTGDSFEMEVDRLSTSMAESLRNVFFMSDDTSNLWYGISYGGLVLNENY